MTSTVGLPPAASARGGLRPRGRRRRGAVDGRAVAGFGDLDAGRQLDREGRALPELAGHGDVAAHHLAEAAA